MLIIKIIMTLVLKYSLALPCCDSDGFETCSTGYTPSYNYLCDSGCYGKSALFLGCNCNSTTQHVQDIYQVSYGATSNIIERCNCRAITNNSTSGRSIMIPAKTASEWNTFLSNLPTGVSSAPGTCP